MANRDIVVVGGSAGALEALKALLPALPGDLPAAVFVVVHIGATRHSVLPEILSRAGPLPAQTAKDGARFERGCVYVAPPDRHLLLDRGRIALRRGPRENLARPAIDPLFRSAAAEFGSRVIGVLLSGMLYDGASGLRAIKRCGGVAVVQADASYPEMPRHALQATEVDHRVRAADLGSAAGPARGRAGRPLARGAGGRPLRGSDGRGRTGWHRGRGAARHAQPADLPGMRRQLVGDRGRPDPAPPLPRGHAYDGTLLLAEQSDRIDRALWSALRAHEERAALLHRHAEHARARQANQEASRWDELAAEHDQHVQSIRQLVMRDSARG